MYSLFLLPLFILTPSDLSAEVVHHAKALAAAGVEGWSRICIGSVCGSCSTSEHIVSCEITFGGNLCIGDCVDGDCKGGCAPAMPGPFCLGDGCFDCDLTGKQFTCVLEADGRTIVLHPAGDTRACLGPVCLSCFANPTADPPSAGCSLTSPLGNCEAGYVDGIGFSGFCS